MQEYFPSFPETPFAVSSGAVALIDPRQQALGVKSESFLSPRLGIEGARAQMRAGPPPHALWLGWEQRGQARSATQALSDFVSAAQRSVPCALARAAIPEPIAMPAEKIPTGTVELRNPPAATDAVHDSRADEIRPRAAEPATCADDAH